MKIRSASALIAASLLLGGCITAPQTPIGLTPDTLSAKSGRVGVAMTVLPKVNTQFPGAGCLLCIATAEAANSALTTHAQALPYEDLPKLTNQLADTLRKKGVDATVIAEPVDLEKIGSNDKDGPNLARKDFTPLRAKYSIDKLLLIDITSLGFMRTYSSYFPTSDPRAYLQGVGSIVNLKTNAYEWYMPVNIHKSADKNWDEPPKFPGLSNAYFQVLELGKDAYLKPFKN